jgi:hypothetical protein
MARGGLTVERPDLWEEMPNDPKETVKIEDIYCNSHSNH